ncbi:cysteine--tRNA ligase [Patescibacteria group bacterium]|nr:cysteine--tRNA ligase [Patescibacteria group bacterium]
MSELYLYNTMSRQKMFFEPLDPAEVKLYTCGPTVYNYAHIGNLRTYVFEDILRRVLEWNGYKVKHVMNITDVGHLTSDADEGEDKMLKGAKREKITVWDIAEKYAQAFLEDMDRLNLLMPHIKPKATDHIDTMIDQIKQLEANGLTYTAGGNVYYDTSKFPDYGKMAQLEKQELQAGARIEVDPNKKNPHDFVLWFTKSKFLTNPESVEGEDQEMQWDSPWGRGYPGWHIECSAMSMKYLGKQMDIHCGGIDHIPVHHTNEIAQAEGTTNVKPWVLYWMHGNFLVLEKDEKMAKSADNFLKLDVLIEKGYNPLDYRYFTLQAHYRKELTFSWEGLDAAKTGLRRLREKVCNLNNGSTIGSTTDPQSEYLEQFESAINDDLNMPEALATAWELLDDPKISNADKLATIKKFDTVLGLKLDEPITFELPPQITQWIVERNEARDNKDWGKADEIRDKIQESGKWLVKDGPSGTEVMPK